MANERPPFLTKILAASLEEVGMTQAGPKGARTALGAPAERTKEQEVAIEAGRSLLLQALKAHAWTRNDARQFLRLLPQMPVAEHNEVLSMLARGINSGELKVAFAGPPLAHSLLSPVADLPERR